MPRLGKAKIAQLHVDRNGLKRVVKKQTTQDGLLHWMDELRVMEWELKGAGEHIRFTKKPTLRRRKKNGS